MGLDDEYQESTERFCSRVFSEPDCFRRRDFAVEPHRSWNKYG